MKRVRLAMTVEVPDDTDPAFVAVTLTTALEDGGGKASNWGEWTTGPLEVTGTEIGTGRYAGGATWAPPPPDCPETGWPQFDDPAYDMCRCGHRHVRLTVYAGGGPGASSAVHHAHGPDDPCNSRCCIIGGGGGAR